VGVVLELSDQCNYLFVSFFSVKDVSDITVALLGRSESMAS
jgi:hypothetical protein